MNMLSCHPFFDGNAIGVIWFFGTKVLVNEFVKEVWNLPDEVHMRVIHYIKQSCDVEHVQLRIRGVADDVVLFCNYESIDSILSTCLCALNLEDDEEQDEENRSDSRMYLSQLTDFRKKYRGSNLDKFFTEKIKEKRVDEAENEIDKLCLLAARHPDALLSVKRKRPDCADVVDSIVSLQSWKKEVELRPIRKNIK